MRNGSHKYNCYSSVTVLKLSNQGYNRPEIKKAKFRGIIVDVFSCENDVVVDVFSCENELESPW